MKEMEIIKNIRENLLMLKIAHIQEKEFFLKMQGSLTLKSVVDRSALMASLPDNQGRDNLASSAIMDIIKKSKLKTLDFFNAKNGSYCW